MATAEEFARDLDRAVEVADREAAALRQLPGVAAVGAGPERAAGRLTGRAAVVVTVRAKLTPEELADAGRPALPVELDGVPVDVVELGAPVESPELRAAFERAAAAKASVVGELLGQPNVTGVGVGYKTVAGVSTQTVAVRVYVARKVPPAEVAARGWSAVAPDIDGVATDVIEAGPFRATVGPSGSRGDRQDPLTGGLSVGHASAPFTYGTLGAIVFDAGGQAMALSNEHVFAGDIGETVHQPSPVGLDDSFEIEFQLDVCDPADFVRLDTPDTLGGSILAGAAAAVAAAAALSDEIDPTREGQQATPPPAGAVTTEEYTKVTIDYPRWPLPGTAFPLDVDWRYERRTTAGTFAHGDTPHRVNPHVLRYHRLFVDRPRYAPDQTIRMLGVLIPGPAGVSTHVPPARCERYHCVAILHPTDRDRSFPVVLRPLAEDPDRVALLRHFVRRFAEADVTPAERELIVGTREKCLFVGSLPAADLPLGPWRHWMHVQTVNVVPPGTDPLDAARIIGGLPLSNHYRATLDVACGPFVFDDDGTFDIEPVHLR